MVDVVMGVMVDVPVLCHGGCVGHASMLARRLCQAMGRVSCLCLSACNSVGLDIIIFLNTRIGQDLWNGSC